jgi:hypothetical protein
MKIISPITSLIPQQWWDFSIALFVALAAQYTYDLLLFRVTASMTGMQQAWVSGAGGKLLFELPLLGIVLYGARLTYQSRRAFAIGLLLFAGTFMLWHLAYLLIFLMG